MIGPHDKSTGTNDSRKLMKGVHFKNGNYFLDYRLPTGKRIREKIGPSRKLAENVLCKRRVAIAEDRHLDVLKKERIKFEDFAQQYLNLHAKQHKKSWKTDFHIIKILERFFKGKYLYEITPIDIEHFKMARSNEKVRDKKVSNTTVNRELDVLSIIFSKAVAWDKLKSSPMKLIKSLKVPQGRLRFLEKEEIPRLVSNCTKNLRPVLVLALFTGMRRGEILGIQWCDVDFRRDIITLLETKNGTKREVSMNGLVRAELLGVRKHPDTPYVFCNKKGVPVHDIRKSFSTALKKSGITNFRFHDLRHTFASQLAMSGVDLNTIRELLGHKDMTMTLRYSHLAQSHKQKAVEILVKNMDTFWTLEKKAENSNNIQGSQVVNKQLVATN